MNTLLPKTTNEAVIVYGLMALLAPYTGMVPTSRHFSEHELDVPATVVSETTREFEFLSGTRGLVTLTVNVLGFGDPCLYRVSVQSVEKDHLGFVRFHDSHGYNDLAQAQEGFRTANGYAKVRVSA